MGKYADKYLKVCPWEVVEEGFDPDYGRVSESVFSLGNEYMGVRGYFDEGFSGDQLIGSYLNGVFEEGTVNPPGNYKGLVTHICYMVNTVDWLYTRISIDGETLDLAKSDVSGFTRCLDMKKGILTRRFIWNTSAGKVLRITFTRFLSMLYSKLGCQKVTLEPVNFSGKIHIRSGLDFSPIHEAYGKNFWSCPKKGKEGDIIAILGKTAVSGHKILSACRISSIPPQHMQLVEDIKFIGFDFDIDLEEGIEAGFEKMTVNHAEKNPSISTETAWEHGMQAAGQYCTLSYDNQYSGQIKYWDDVWMNSDITIDGDMENQQGIRYCIFQMHQTYHGEAPDLNIGAKGLTGEAYNGNAFWDTETYCLPFYIFNNPKAAHNLIDYRYRTLPKAMERAKELDCEGAFYPVATLDGSETCTLWQHASLQLQASTAVAYGIWHYHKLLFEKEFLYAKGIEVLVQVSRMLASRGQWGQKTGKFGFYSVMGPDEFQMMVNNNCYTNFMGQKTFLYTLEVISEMEADCPQLLSDLVKKIRLDFTEMKNWKKMAENMYIPYDTDTGIFEQHDGFFNLPHLDIQSIPADEFPLYHCWSYDRIYRNDMIKQPDVLMFMFLYSQEFSYEAKKANYEFYEPRCIHESSLSPSIHSIFASELGKQGEAFDFFRFATRMDLDNYNRNTREGLHTTSIAAAWMNIVYGFGGMRSDGDLLVFNPSIPEAWDGYSFRVQFRGAVLLVDVRKKIVSIRTLNGAAVSIIVYGLRQPIGMDPVVLRIPDPSLKAGE
jgi:maltose phosphorylase